MDAVIANLHLLAEDDQAELAQITGCSQTKDYKYSFEAQTPRRAVLISVEAKQKQPERQIMRYFSLLLQQRLTFWPVVMLVLVHICRPIAYEKR